MSGKFWRSAPLGCSERHAANEWPTCLTRWAYIATANRIMCI